MKKVLFVACLSVGVPAMASTFAEAVAVCEVVYSKIAEPQDDQKATFHQEGRINVSFLRPGGKVVCSVGTAGMEIEQVSTGGYTIGKDEIKRAHAQHTARIQDRERIAKGDYSDFIKRSKRAVADKFKDPDSVRFRDLFISDGAAPTLCGQVNAKNSYGAYTGYRGFFQNGLMAYVDDGDPLGNGFMYKRLQPDHCGKKIADVEQ